MGAFGLNIDDDAVFIKRKSPQKKSKASPRVSQSNEAWKTVIQKTNELEESFKALMETKFLDSKTPDEQDTFGKHTENIDKMIELMKKKNQEMNQQVTSSISSVKERNKKMQEEIEAEKEKIQQEQLRKQEELVKKREMEERLKQEEIKKEQEQIKQEAAAQSLKNLEKQAAQPSNTPHLESKAQTNEFDPQFASKEAHELYISHLKITRDIKQNFREITATDKKAQNHFFMKKMVVTQKVGQLTNSIQKIKEIAIALNGVLSDAQSVSSSMYEWLMDFTAKAIKQAEREVAVKKDMAFPLALVCVLLYGKHGDFLPILLGRLMKKCSYVAAVYIKRIKGQTDSEYMKSVGYKKNFNDEFETEAQYGERMCGVLALYFALVQTQPGKNTHGIEYGWTWIARILNMKPRKITPLLLFTFFEITGNAFISSFKGQAFKVIDLLIGQYFKLIPEKAVAAKTKLQLFLEESYCRTRSIPVLQGSEMSA